jgi:hypothetical protein
MVKCADCGAEIIFGKPHEMRVTEGGVTRVEFLCQPCAEGPYPHLSAQIPINKPIDPGDATFEVCVAHPCGGNTLYLGRDELDQYNRDPDGYAAKHFGFDTAEEYREWINVTGAALCGARTKSGRLCGHLVSRIQLNPTEWKELHRNVFCAVHSNAGGRS